MSDFFREVDEEVRRDRVIELWKKYQTPLIALALAIILGTAAWEGWQYWQRTRAEAASKSFDTALDLANGGKFGEAKVAFEKLAATTSTGYRDLAKLMAADATAEVDATGGVKAFDALAADATLAPLFRDVARLRAALLVYDSADAKALQARLEPLASAAAPFRNTAREMLALAALRRNDAAAATRWLGAILVDPSAPADLRRRTSGYMGYVRGMKPAPGS